MCSSCFGPATPCARRTAGDEWEHALALQRPLFIRPLYWEEPRPEDPSQKLPPVALQALHFVKVLATEPYSVVPSQAPARDPALAN